MKSNNIKNRIYDYVVINDIPLLTLFDTGAQRSYVTQSGIERCKAGTSKLKHHFSTALGGKHRTIKEDLVTEASIHNLPCRLHLYVIDELFKTPSGEDVDMLFGLLDMEEYGIELNLKEKKLDLSHFATEFTEY